jgi:hypothetical protein
MAPEGAEVGAGEVPHGAVGVSAPQDDEGDESREES